MGSASGDTVIQELLEVAPIGIALIDQTRRFVWVNDALCNLLGYSRAEFMNLEVTEISHPETMNEDTRERFLRGEMTRVTLEKRQLTKEGDTRWVHVNACIFRPGDQGTEYGALFVEDVSDRVRMEQELARRSSIAMQMMATLTTREKQLLELLTAGHTIAEIADSLVISKRTVESHVAAAYRKLGVNGREEAIRKLAEMQSLIDIRTTFSAATRG